MHLCIHPANDSGLVGPEGEVWTHNGQTLCHGVELGFRSRVGEVPEDVGRGLPADAVR